MSEDLDYEAMHRLVRARYETPPTKVFDHEEPYVPIEHSIRNSPKFDYLGDPDHWPEEGDTGFAGDYEDDSDEYADKATSELVQVAPNVQGERISLPVGDREPLYDYSNLPPEQQLNYLAFRNMIAKQPGVWTDDYDNLMEQKTVDAGGRGQATTKPGSSRVTAGERETYFADWETEGMTDEELMQIGAHPSQRKTLPPMDTTREHTVADKERRAQQVAERQAAGEQTADGLTDAQRDTYLNMRQGIAISPQAREGGTGGGGGTDGGGPEGLGYDSPTVQTNTDIYKKHLPKELHNDPMALAEAAKDAAAENYFDLMEKNNNEPKEDWGVEIDGEPWTEMIFANGETFFVSEDESQILRGKDQES